MTRLFVLLCSFLLAPALAAQPLPFPSTAADDGLGRFDVGTTEAAFVENRGQWPAEVAFLARLNGVDVWVTSAGLVFDFYDRDAQRGRVLRARFVGGRATQIEGRRPSTTYHNYLFGNDPARWATRVPVYEEVVLRDVYDGVSLRLRGEGGLQHEWVFAPSAEVDAVEVAIDGAEGLSASGSLDRAAALGIEASRPGLDRLGARGEPAARREGGARLGFARFFGGADIETVRALALDANAAAYFGGSTKSDDLPTPDGYDQEREGGRADAYLARVSPDGGLRYGTYLGGNRDDEVLGLAHANDSVYLTGVTESPNFPTTPGAYEEEGSPPSREDAFVTRLRTDGSGPVFSTFLGGGEDDDDDDGDDDDLNGEGGDGDDDAGTAIAVAGNGSVVVGGRTRSEEFPAPNGEYDDRGDAFVIVLSGDGTAVQGGRFLGGSQLDAIRAVELGGGGIYVAGDTRSGNFPDLEGGYGGGVDAFVARLSLNGNAVLGGAFIGGSGPEGATGNGNNDRTASIDLALGSGGAVYVSGETASDDFPATFSIGPRGGTDAFVTRLNAQATAITGTTIFGGSGTDRARGLGIGPGGAVHLVGETTSDDFPVSNADFDAYGGDGDAFVVQLTSNGDAVSYGTYFGGSEADGAFDLAVRPDGLTYVVGVTESGSDFPVTSGAPAFGGGADAFVATFDLAPNAPPTVVSPIGDTSLTLGEAPLVIDLGPVFDDPDGDALSYECASDTPGVAAVGDCAGGTLTVTAVAAGVATVTVTASDPDGASAEDAFAVTVTNPAPIVVAPIEDAVLALGDAPLVVDLTAVFDDPNGDALAYACQSDDPDVVTVGGCAGGTLTVTPEGAGTATVTVTADDGTSEAADLFDVEVSDPPPVVVRPIPDLQLRLGGVPFVVDLDTVFADPNDDLGFTASTDDGAVTLALAGSVLTVTASAPGTATVAATATGGAEEAADVFVVTVAENLPPVVVAPIGDTPLSLGADPLAIDLAAVFEDPEGDALTYACSSSAPGVASVGDCADGTLEVSPIADGAAAVTVTASDPAGASAVDAFVATVGCAPASIFSVTVSPEEPERGASITVITVAERGSEADLSYRQSGAASWVEVPMMRSGGGFAATIPGRAVTARGVEYFVEARSACGAAGRSGVTVLRVRVPGGIASPVLPAVTGQAGYRLVSIPLALEDETAASVFADFGTVDEEAWRLFELLPPGVAGDSPAVGTDGQWYRAAPADIEVEPGEGFWLIARDGGSFNTGAGTTVASDEPFALDLHRGWNLVGAPFGYELPLDRVRTASGAPLRLQAYDGEWRNVTESMTPFQGYALRVESDDRLVIEPTSGARGPAGEAGVQPSVRASSGLDGGWGVEIIAEIGGARDGNNTALVVQDAAEGLDPADWFEPPPIGDYVSLSFNSASEAGAPLTVDARPAFEEGASWPLTVRSTLEGRVTLTFEGTDSVPSDFVVWLVDEAAAVVRDLRRTSRYSIASEGGGSASSLRLVIGTEAYARRASGFDGATPLDYHLAPSYPNPFRSTTTIHYALPRAEHVVVEVFDVTGRRVAVLVDGEVEAGYHTVVWDGRGGRGELASGLYLYRLRAGSFTATRRAVLAR